MVRFLIASGSKYFDQIYYMEKYLLFVLVSVASLLFLKESVLSIV